ncbi:hypothetical protein [Rufibacter sp. LB8]|uniref:hypothetical protein n=1 Tax=Rufibacter sp. LB8 TaxID=2777781 RepID=UPI00178C6326|nr:hypothetical protein [Rufibacter sp. LB8]
MNRHATTLLKSNCYEIVLFPQWLILQMNWLGNPSSVQYREGSQRFIGFLEKYHCKKLLSDSTKRGTPLPQDMLWITHYLVPNLCQEGVEQLALVVPNNPNHARELELCLMTGAVCYQLQFFHSTAEAFDWLKSDQNHLSGAAVA